MIKVTYFLEVVSSWCFWAEPAWTKLKERFGSVATFEWKIALMDASGLPASRAQLDWFYRRSGTLVGSAFMLNGDWLEEGTTEYLAPNAVAEAAREMGVAGDEVRLALAEAALRRGEKVGQWAVAARIGALSGGLPEDHLQQRAMSSGIRDRLRASTAEFHSLRVTQRPTFIIEDEIGDRAVISGLARAEALASVIEAMVEDCRGYRSWKAHFGGPPPG